MNKKAKRFAIIAAISGALAVASGAFGAHGLKNISTPEMLAIWETAVRYQFYHTLSLLIVAFGAPPQLWTSSRCLALSSWCWVLGTVIFSGSLFALVLTDIRVLGAVTPIGGVLLILGWGALVWGILKEGISPEKPNY